ncbi:UNVERIFIED_CONTAM: hypothetical protein NCL1_27026 [Trichonephila clavipes]
MTTSKQKVFSKDKSRFPKSESAITVQRAFRIKFGCQPSNDNNILRQKYGTTKAVTGNQLYLVLPILILFNYGYFLNRKKVNQITSFVSKVVHSLTGISQYAIG